jgi:hypothetical protein
MLEMMWRQFQLTVSAEYRCSTVPLPIAPPIGRRRRGRRMRSIIVAEETYTIDFNEEDEERKGNNITALYTNSTR